MLGKRTTSCIFSILLFFLSALLGFHLPAALAAHGISIDGKLKYGPNFSHFDYVSPEAIKGGTLNLHALGSFDKLNPFTLKGNGADGLSLLVFETLAAESLDEPFAKYGLLAKDISLARDGMSVTFTINEKARFSDNSPVTVEDVKFSLDTLKSGAAHPFYQAYYQDISHAEILDAHRIRFRFARRNREIHMIAAQLPVFSKKFYTAHPFDSPSMEPPLGSGPYTIVKIDQGKTIVYQRNPDYWGKELPVRRGMFNFDRIVYKYFKDQIVSLEAFKAHEFDFMYINIAKQWARDLDGPKFDSGVLKKEMLPHHNNAGMQGFVFNIRRPLFGDRRVRQALSLAMDFEWTNTALFFDQYTRCDSYFSNSPLAASNGRPEGLELKYLAPHRDKLPAEVFNELPTPFSTKPPGSLRRNLLKARDLLAAAGWRMQDGLLVNQAGQPFEFEILLVSPSFERVMAPYARNLRKIGIIAHYRTMDPALYIRRLQKFEFDMTVNVFGQSQSPGNEQRDYWHSSTADREGSNNLIGIKNPVVDELVDRIIYAVTQEELTAACRALDRVLWYEYYVVPNWYIGSHRVTYRDIFARPATLPLFYSPEQLLMTWWLKKPAENGGESR